MDYALSQIPVNALPIRGYDFNEGIDFSRMMSSYLTTGFQATHLAKAIQVGFEKKNWVDRQFFLINSLFDSKLIEKHSFFSFRILPLPKEVFLHFET